MPQSRVVLIVLLLLAALGVVMHLVITAEAMGVTPDSVNYIGAARNLMQGRGLTLPFGRLAGEPVTHWPPLYPTLLAGLGRTNPDLLTDARLLNAALFGLLIFLVGYAIRSHTRSFWIPLFGAFLVLASMDMVDIHVHVWSDALFLLLSLAGLLFLARHLVSSRMGLLVSSAALAALAFLTRYAGVALILAGLVSLLVLDRRSFPARLAKCLVFAAVSALPMALWLVLGQTARPRPLAFHPITMD
jgi:4-amino-4-deoxy-L-arabinose transferase-like glycosyltransferase